MDCRALSFRPEAEGRSGEIWLQMVDVAYAVPDASTSLGMTDAGVVWNLSDMI